MTVGDGISNVDVGLIVSNKLGPGVSAEIVGVGDEHAERINTSIKLHSKDFFIILCPLARQIIKSGLYGRLMLPTIIPLIPQLHQQISRHILEQLLVLFGEMLFPPARLPRAEGMTLLRLDRIH